MIPDGDFESSACQISVFIILKFVLVLQTSYTCTYFKHKVNLGHTLKISYLFDFKVRAHNNVSWGKTQHHSFGTLEIS